MRRDFDEEEENEEVRDLVRRFEQAMRRDEPFYFVVDDIDMLVGYYFEQDNLKKAAQAVEYGLKFYPNDDLLITLKINVLMEQNQYIEAYELAKKVKNPTHDVNYMRAEMAIRFGNFKEGAALFNKITDDINNDVDLFHNIAYIFHEMGCYDLEQRFLKKGLKFFPNNVDLILELATFYADAGNKENEALKLFNRALDIDPYNEYAWANIGHIYLYKQKYDKALEALDFAISIKDFDENLWLCKAECHYRLNQNEEAIAACETFLKRNPANKAGQCLYGEMLMKTGRHNEAIKIFKRLHRDKQWRFEACVGLFSCIHAEGNDPVKAFGYLKEAEKINPKSEILLHIYAQLKEAMVDNSTPKKIKELEQIYKDNPDDIAAITELAHAYFNAQDLENALIYFKKAFEMEPTNNFTALSVVMCFGLLGDYDNMNHYLELAKDQEDFIVSSAIRLFPDLKKHFKLGKKK